MDTNSLELEKEPVYIDPKIAPSAPTEQDELAEPSSDFSLSSFQSNTSQYEQLFRPEVYVQKGYEERELDKSRAMRITGDVDFTPTEKLTEFKEEIEHLDKLREPLTVSSKPNWLQSLISIGQKITAEKTETPPELQISAPDFYQNYFVDGVKAKNILTFNPEFTAPEQHLLKRAMVCQVSAKELAGSGLLNVNSLQLSRLGIMMMHFRLAGRTPSDLKTMFNTVENLENAGFTAESFDSKLWTLKGIAAAYGKTTTEIACHFRMPPSSILNAGVPAKELADVGVKMKHLAEDPALFQVIMAARTSPQNWMKTFDAVPRQFIKDDGTSKLNKEQISYLADYADWNDINLKRAGFSEAEIDALKGNVALRVHPK